MTGSPMNKILAWLSGRIFALAAGVVLAGGRNGGLPQQKCVFSFSEAKAGTEAWK